MQHSDTLIYVNRGVVTFTNADNFPPQWYEGLLIQTDIKVFGYTSLTDYRIHFVRIDQKNKEIETKEGGGDLQQWDHIMRLEPGSDNQSCWYTDEVGVSAGTRTWIV
jgi:hypothetical protein